MPQPSNGVVIQTHAAEGDEPVPVTLQEVESRAAALQAFRCVVIVHC